MKNWNVRKTIIAREDMPEEHRLTQSLSWPHLIALGVGAIVGTGILTLTGVGAAKAGPAVILSFAIAGVICAFAVGLKTKAGYDDALDVVGVHLVGGLVGSLLIGLFSDPDHFGNDVMAGLFHGGGLGLLGEQALANGVTILYSGIVTFGLLSLLKITIGVRVSDEVEDAGLDLAEHGETAYHETNA